MLYLWQEKKKYELSKYQSIKFCQLFMISIHRGFKKLFVHSTYLGIPDINKVLFTVT